MSPRNCQHGLFGVVYRYDIWDTCFLPNVHLRHNTGICSSSVVWQKDHLADQIVRYVVYTDESKFFCFASEVFFVSDVEFEKVSIHGTQVHAASLTPCCGVPCYILSICFGVP